MSTTVEISGCKKVVKVKNFLKKSEVGFVDITESGDKWVRKKLVDLFMEDYTVISCVLFSILVECSSAEDAKKLLDMENPQIKGKDVQIKAAAKTPAPKPAAASPKKEKQNEAGPPPAKKSKGK